MKPDFMLYDANSRLVLVAEVKATKNSGADWASKWRRNLAAHGNLPPAEYFLLVLPEHVYLWKDARSAREVAPDFVTETKSLLKRYLPPSKDDLLRLSESGLELAVRSWLNDITIRPPLPSVAAENQLLKESGLADRVRQGSLVYGDA